MRTRGLILIVLPLACQLVFIGLLLHAQREGADAARNAGHSGRVIAQFYRVVNSVTEAQNALRGFVLLRTPALDEAFIDARGRVAGEIDRLQQLVGGSTEDARRVARIRYLADDLLNWLSGTAEMVRRGEHDAAMARIATRTTRDMVQELDDFLAASLRSAARREEEADAIERRATWLLLAGTFAAFAVTGALAFLFSRDVASRLATLEGNARRVASRQPLAEPLDGEDEIARVDRAFHEMSAALMSLAERERLVRAQLEASAVELMGVNRELRERNVENELFVYSVSHDLRSPLVNLQGFSRELHRACEELAALIPEAGNAHAVPDRMRELLDRDMKEAIHFMSTSVSRLGTIIDGLLRLSRVGRLELRPQVVDVRALVDKVVDSLRTDILGRALQVKVEHLPPCMADPAALEQAFANLLDNAIKYSHPGRAGTIEIGALPAPGEDHFIDYYVKDDGVGIAEADRARLFVPFNRGSNHGVQGEGIGLSLVRRIAERHGGQAWFESAPGTGSIFHVTFPALRTATSAGRASLERATR